MTFANNRLSSRAQFVTRVDKTQFVHPWFPFQQFVRGIVKAYAYGLASLDLHLSQSPFDLIRNICSHGLTKDVLSIKSIAASVQAI